jgi:hypothetical protein
MQTMNRCIAALSVALSATALAGAPDKLAEGAGPQPSPSQAREAVIDALKRSAKDPVDLSRVRFFSGPLLVTGTNFAGGREQAWLMCVVEGNARLSAKPLDLELKPYLLRTRNNRVEVVELTNWAESGTGCEL